MRILLFFQILHLHLYHIISVPRVRIKYITLSSLIPESNFMEADEGKQWSAFGHVFIRANEHVLGYQESRL